MCAPKHTSKKEGVSVAALTESKPAYWRCSLRLSRLIKAHCHWLAIREGWEIADFARMLISLGAVVSFLSLKEQGAARWFKRRAILSETVGALDSVLGKQSRRPYASPGIAQSELLTVHLPSGLTRTIRVYANTSNMSMNHALGMFLECGLIIYMKGENNLLETIRSLTQELAEMKKQENGRDRTTGPRVD